MIALAKCHVQRPLPQLSSLGEDATPNWRPMRKLPVPPVDNLQILPTLADARRPWLLQTTLFLEQLRTCGDQTTFGRRAGGLSGGESCGVTFPSLLAVPHRLESISKPEKSITKQTRVETMEYSRNTII